jgi:hypothetical protein
MLDPSCGELNRYGKPSRKSFGMLGFLREEGIPDA